MFSAVNNTGVNTGQSIVTILTQSLLIFKQCLVKVLFCLTVRHTSANVEINIVTNDLEELS